MEEACQEKWNNVALMTSNSILYSTPLRFPPCTGNDLHEFLPAAVAAAGVASRCAATRLVKALAAVTAAVASSAMCLGPEGGITRKNRCFLFCL